MFFGAFIALVVPISALGLALLVQSGIAPYDQTRSSMDAINLVLGSEILLGPIGLVIVGRAARLRGAIAWLALIIVAVPALAFIWLMCLLILSGALGYPF
jgi:hypothetical protein